MQAIDRLADTSRWLRYAEEDLRTLDYPPHTVVRQVRRLTRLFVAIEVVTAGSHSPKEIAFRKPRPFQPFPDYLAGVLTQIQVFP